MSDATELRDAAVFCGWLHPDERAEALAILMLGKGRYDAAAVKVLAEWEGMLAGGGARFPGREVMAVERVTKTQIVLRVSPHGPREGGEVRVNVADGRRIGATPYYGGAPRVGLTHLGLAMRAKLLGAMEARGSKVDPVWRGMVESAPETPEVAP